MKELERLRVVVYYELLKQIRRRRFYGALIITLLAVGLAAGLYQGLNLAQALGIETLLEQWDAEVFSLFMTRMSALAIIAAVFFAGDAIAGEFEQRTGYILFPNPVKRSTIVVGKYLACLVAMAMVLLAGYGLSALLTLGLYGRIPIGILGSLAVTLAGGCAAVSFSVFFSSALKGSMGASVAALLTLFVVSPIISSALGYSGHNPWFMPDRAMDGASAYGIPMESFAGMFEGSRVGLSMLEASFDATLSFLTLMGYATGLFALAVWLAERREMV